MRKEQRFNAFQDRVLSATCHGYPEPSSPPGSGSTNRFRSQYFNDYSFMLDTLSRLGLELRSYPGDTALPIDVVHPLLTDSLALSAVAHRNFHLKNAISQCNSILFNRMVTFSNAAARQHRDQTQQTYGGTSQQATDSQQGREARQDEEHMHPYEGIYSGFTAADIAARCPEVAKYSLHLPLLHSRDRIQRILRFVESECEILPSRDRCPYVVVVEVLAEAGDAHCSDSSLFTHRAGGSGGLSSPTALLQSSVPMDAQQQYVDYDAYDFSAAPSVAGEELAGAVESDSEQFLSAEGASYEETLAGRGPSDYVIGSRRNRKQQREMWDVAVGEVSDRAADIATPLVENVKLFGREDVDLSTLEGYHAGNGYDLRTPHSGVVAPQSATKYITIQNAEQYFQKNKAAVQSAHSAQNMRGGVVQTPSTASTGTPLAKISNTVSPRFRRSHKSAPSAATVSSEVSGSGAESIPPSNSSPDVEVTVEGELSEEQVREGDAADYQLLEELNRGEPVRTPERHLSIHSAGVLSSSGHLVSSQHNLNAVVRQNTPPDRRSTTATALVQAKTHADHKAVLRANSPFGHLPGWDVASFVVKSGDDVNKEILAMQLIAHMQSVFRAEGLDIYLKPYQILSTGYQSGLIEYLEGTHSIDRIKKSASGGASSTSSGGGLISLKDHFEFSFGPSYNFVHAKAVQNFVKSLVGYSLVTYLLQVCELHRNRCVV